MSSRRSSLLPVLFFAVISFAVASGEPSAATPFYPDKMNLLVWRDAQGGEHEIQSPQDWSRRREHILANIQAVMGPLPGRDQRVPLDVQIISTEELPHVV